MNVNGANAVFPWKKESTTMRALSVAHFAVRGLTCLARGLNTLRFAALAHGRDPHKDMGLKAGCLVSTAN